MSNDIVKLKRGTLAVIPSLLNGEQYLATDEIEVFIGTDTGNKSILFQIKESRTINLFVAVTGSDLSDGLTVSTPFKTIQKAFDTIETNKHLGKVVSWVVNLAAGLYQVVNESLTTPTNKRVLIQGADVGGHPNIPTTVLSGSGNVADFNHGIRIGGVGVRAHVKDIKFIDFVSNNNRIGLVGENESDLFTENVHADNCDWTGIYAFNTVRARVKGGILNNCRSGFITNSTQTTIGYLATGISSGTQITNCTESGVYWSRGSQGHADFCSFDDNAIGLLIAENSRVSAVSNDFKRNTVGVKAQTGGVFGDTTNEYNEGGANENTTLREYKAHSGETNELRFSEDFIRVDFDRTTYNPSGLGLSVIASPYTLPKYRLQGVGKTLRIKVYGVITQMTNGSFFNVKIGGMTVVLNVIGGDTGVPFEVNVDLLEVAGGYRAFGNFIHGLSNRRMATATSGFDVTVDNIVSLEVDLANAGDDIFVYRIESYIMG